MSKSAEIGPLIVKGKTKSVFKDLNDSKKVIVVFRNDITAGDGEKHKQMTGKAIVDCETNTNIFELLIKQQCSYALSPPAFRYDILGRES